MGDIGDYAEALKSAKKPLKPSDFKPSDCKYCEVASVGVFGAHYACMNENRMDYPLVMCPQDCEHYEQESSLFGEE